MDEWIDLLTGKTSPDDAGPLLSQAAGDLQALLEAQPELEMYILDIIEKRLGDATHGQTWQALDESLSNYLGKELAYLLSWLVQADQSDRLNILRQYASPQAMRFLRTVLGLYGTELGRALSVWNELPDNWESISREVFFDQLASSYRMQVKIRKFNGQETLIEGPGDSILALASYVLLTARLAGTADAFSQDRIDLFLDETTEFLRLLPKEQVDTFITKLQEEAPEETAEEGTDKAS